MRRLNNRLASALLCFVYQNKITAKGKTVRQREKEGERERKTDREKQREVLALELSQVIEMPSMTQCPLKQTT